MGHIYRAARGILKDAGLGHLDPYDMRSHPITKPLSDPNVSDQMYIEIVGHVGNAMKRRHSKQRMENKRGAMDAMCETMVELCERQADAEVEARNKQIQSEVRTPLGLQDKPPPSAASVRDHAPNLARRPPKLRASDMPLLRRRRVVRWRRMTDQPPQVSVNLMDPAIQAEIARQVALALERDR